MANRRLELRKRAIERSRSRRGAKAGDLQQTCKFCGLRFVGVGDVCGHCEGRFPRSAA